jgi:hypothetical protein
MQELLRLDHGAAAIVHDLLSIPPTGWKAKVAAKKGQYLSGNYKTPAFGIVESRAVLQQATFITLEGHRARSYVVTRTGSFDPQLFDAICNVCSIHSPTVIEHEITLAAGLEQAFQTAWIMSRLGRFTDMSQMYPGQNESSTFMAIIKYPA